jgi:hypothetical protein
MHVSWKTNKEITMTSKTYSVKGNRTAADVIANREETIETGYTLAEAKIAAVEMQRSGEFVAAWVEEEEAPASPLLDTLKFAVIVADAKGKTKDLKWLRAINRAAEGILSGELIVTTLQHGALVTSANGTYMANGSCQCKAAKHGHRECYHRAAGRLMELYEAAPGLKPTPETRRQAKITRLIERGPSVGAMWFATAGD